MEKVEDLRDHFLRAVHGGFPVHKKDVERVKTDTKWLRMFLKTSGHSVFRALVLLKEACSARLEKGVNDLVFDKHHDTVHSHILKPHGTDPDGCIVLLLNTLKFKTFKPHCSRFGLRKTQKENLNDALMYWFEKLYFQDDIKKFSVAIYTRTLIDAENLPVLLCVVSTHNVIYPGCINKLFLFEDHLNRRAKLNAKRISALDPIFIKKSNVHEYLTMNLEELEEEQMSPIIYVTIRATVELCTKFAEPHLPKTAVSSNHANVTNPGSSIEEVKKNSKPVSSKIAINSDKANVADTGSSMEGVKMNSKPVSSKIAINSDKANVADPGSSMEGVEKKSEPMSSKTAANNKANIADPGSSMVAGVEDSSVALETKEKANNLDLTLVMKKLVDVQLQVNMLVQEILKEIQ